MAKLIEQTSTSMVIRVRHSGPRFLAAFLGAVAIVASLQPKHPDAFIVGGLFGVFAVGLAWLMQPITCTMDTTLEQVVICYKGLFGLGWRRVNHPLREITGAEVQTTLGSGLISMSRGQGSRVAFILRTGGRVPLTKGYTGGDYRRNQAIADAIHAFVHSKRRHQHKAEPGSP